MATAHQGRKYSANIKGARVKALKAVNEGLLIANAEVFNLGLREAVQISITSGKNEDGEKRGIADHRLVTITGSTLQPSLAKLQNTYLLSKCLNVVQVELVDGYFMNFGETVGTEYLTMSWKYAIDQNKAMIAYTWKGRISLAKAETLETESTAGHTGETGGTTAGLSASAYARASYIPGNFRSLQITNSSGAALIGAFSEASYELESMGEEDHMERPIHRKYKYNTGGRAHQTLKADRQAWNTDLQEDTTLLWTLTNGNTIKINQAAVDAEFMDGDEKREIVFSATGEVTSNADDASPNCIDIGIGSATRLETTHISAA